MTKEQIRDSILTKVNKIIKEIESLESQFENLGKLPDYHIYSNEIINELSSMYGLVDNDYVGIEGTLHIPISGQAAIYDENDQPHDVRKRFVEIDVEGNGQYFKVHMNPSKDIKQNDTWHDLIQYNGKKARFV
ncbi:hypothetical protein ABEP16_22555 [Priestia aryabhattai]|uniref:hypothetical protein n=1 Tax=Priestia aryabhattai TaxID=412384 RepID=UPI003D2A8E5E